MKRILLISIVVAALFASCGPTGYVVTDSLTRSLDGIRTLLTDDTTALDGTPYALWPYTVLPAPQVFDMHTRHDTMRYSYSQALQFDGWTVVSDSLSRMLRPEVTVEKRFRWFTTRYRYTARFARLDSLPVPVGDYLTDDEQQLLFGCNEWPADWNGAEMYALLDDLNAKYVRWWSHCFFEKQYECYCDLADSAQRALLTQYHDTLLALVQADLPNKQTTLEQKAKLFPDLAFMDGLDHQLHRGVQLSVSAWEEEYSEMENRVLWRVEMPGGRTEEHMISTERLITDDYVIDVESGTVNWWAIALTLLAALAAVWLPWCRKARI